MFTDKDILDVCQKKIYHDVASGYIRTPSYPFYYPTTRDCACVLKANKYNARWKMSILDLTLEMGEFVKCADYLVVQHGWIKIRKSDIHCGEIINGNKNITIHDTRAMMHFHSNENDLRRQIFPINNERHLRGFWLYFEGK